MSNVETILETIQALGDEKLYNHFINKELLTFAEWKRKGYQVQRGQKAVLQVPIWIKVIKKAKKKEEKDEYKFIRRKASFFVPEQVKKIESKKEVIA